MKEETRLEAADMQASFKDISNGLELVVRSKMGEDIGYTLIAHPQSPSLTGGDGVLFYSTLESDYALGLLQVLHDTLAGQSTKPGSASALDMAMTRAVQRSDDVNAKIDMLHAMTRDLTKKLFGDDKGCTVVVHVERPVSEEPVEVYFASSLNSPELVHSLFDFMAYKCEEPGNLETVPYGAASDMKGH